jgi:hypothetical protein
MKKLKVKQITMEKRNEDDLLKQLFGKIEMDKAPDNFTSKVMEQIMADPVIEPAGKVNIEWWWFLPGLLGILSMYVTGVFTYIFNLLAPYVLQAIKPLATYISPLADLFPSNVVVVPSSLILPVILGGIFLVMFIDILFRMQLSRVADL